MHCALGFPNCHVKPNIHLDVECFNYRTWLYRRAYSTDSNICDLLIVRIKIWYAREWCAVIPIWRSGLINGSAAGKGNMFLNKVQRNVCPLATIPIVIICNIRRVILLQLVAGRVRAVLSGSDLNHRTTDWSEQIKSANGLGKQQLAGNHNHLNHSGPLHGYFDCIMISPILYMPKRELFLTFLSKTGSLPYADNIFKCLTSELIKFQNNTIASVNYAPLHMHHSVSRNE